MILSDNSLRNAENTYLTIIYLIIVKHFANSGEKRMSMKVAVAAAGFTVELEDEMKTAKYTEKNACRDVF